MDTAQHRADPADGREEMNDVVCFDAPVGHTPREIAIVIDGSAAVRLWLDRRAGKSRIILEDLENGEEISLTPTRLAELIYSPSVSLDQPSPPS